MQNNIQYDEIEEYLNGTLDKEATAVFEHQLKVDKVLSQELELYKEIRTANQDKGLSDLDAKLKKAYDNTIGSPTKKSATKIWIWAIGAILFIALLYFLSKADSTPVSPVKPQGIYAQFAQYDFSFQEMSAENELAEIQILLEDSQYAKALPKLNAYLLKNPDALPLQLAKGICLLEMGQTDDALVLFTSLKTQSPLYKSEAIWYIALTYLKQGNKVACLNSLGQIPVDSSRYADARQLIQSLEGE